jgi:hypothetical protein
MVQEENSQAGKVTSNPTPVPPLRTQTQKAKVKTFVNVDPDVLDQEVNSWIDCENPTVLQISQFVSPETERNYKDSVFVFYIPY